MKELIIKIKIPLIVVGALFVAFFIYNSFIKTPAPTSLLQKSTSTTSPANDQVAKDILPLLSKIKDISLDDKFFNDPVFVSLQDFGQQIVEEEQGRPNPFAPSFSRAASSSLEGVSFEDISASSTSTLNPAPTTPAAQTPVKKK